MKGYKGFGKGLVCKGKQYAENTVFEEKNAVICRKGMHFCENPLDVLDYYPLLNDDAELNEFAEVEALDDVKTDDKKKYCTTKLKIGAKLTISGFIKAAVDFVFEKCKDAEVTIAVQVNGKMRGTVVMDADLDNDTVIANVLADEKITKFLEKNGGSIVKTIVVKNKLVNLIVK